MKRFFPHLLCIAGLILLFLSLVIRPAIRDGTVEMDLLSETQSERLVILGFIGIVALIIGGMWAVARWLAGRQTA